MTKREIILSIGIIVLILVVALSLNQNLQVAQGGAFPGGRTQLASSTNFAVTGGAVSVLTATSSCTSRVVSTESQGIRITFGDRAGNTPSATQGHWQAASTTVVYDAETTGCDLWRVYPNGTQNITITEFRGSF